MFACSPSDVPEPVEPEPAIVQVDTLLARSRDAPTESLLVDASSTVEQAGPDSVTTKTARTQDETVALTPAQPTDSRYAVLVGINDYPGEEEDLPSGQHDVDAMRSLLIERFGYRSDNILVLTDQRATRGGIQRAIETHLAQAGASGSAVFYYSGHGVQTETNHGRDVEADGRDEAIYVWADDGEHSALILDDEIGVWVSALATDRVLVIADACHSGTVSRGGSELAPKAVRYEDIVSRLESPARGDVLPPASPRHTLLAAAHDNQMALSGLPGEPSLFTKALTTALWDAAPGLELADLMRDVRRVVLAQSRRYQSAHTPQIDGRSQTVADVFGPR
ncbi:MAG: caspase family protein [Bacteroidota bacterium]